MRRFIAPRKKVNAMPEIPSLYKVLPPERRIVETAKMADILEREFYLVSAERITAGEAPNWKMLLEHPVSGARVLVVSSAAMIVPVVEYLKDHDCFPVRVKFIAYGKSYAVTDPGDFTNPAEQETLPGVDAEKENLKP